MNWAGCGSCGSRDLPKIAERSIEEDGAEDDEFCELEEITTFKHLCSACDHFICEHFHKYAATQSRQDFFMECILCGRGTDEKRLDEDATHMKAADEESTVTISTTSASPPLPNDPDNIDRPSPGQVTAGLAAMVASVRINHGDNDTLSHDGSDDDEWD